MTDFQSTDGSILSRDTDDEKSFGSKEYLDTMKDALQQEQDGRGGVKNDNENDRSDNDNKSGRGSVGTRGKDVNKRKYGETGDDDDDNENEKSDDEKDKGNMTDNTSVSKKENKTKTKKVPRRKNLDEGTLGVIEKYLKSGDFLNDTLEYEEVSAFASRIHRYTIERTQGRQGVLFRDGNIHNRDDAIKKLEPIAMTEEDAVEEHMYNQIYQKEEFHAVATDFFKRVVDGAFHLVEPNFAWHTKTSNWLKRAAGLRRQYDPYEKGDNQHFQQRVPTHSDDSDEGEGEIDGGGGQTAPKRVTRRRVQMTLKKRRKERFEKETESFRILSEVALDFAKQPRTGRTKDVEMTDGVPAEIKEPALEFFPTLESTGLTEIDRQSHTMEMQGENEVGRRGNAFEDAALPPAVARLGLEFRPRRLQLKRVQKAQQQQQQQQQRIDQHESRDKEATNRSYARKSKALLNVLSNRRARNWAIHEFFYNDLDREWYQNEGFIADLNKLGLPIDSITRLTKQEWSLVRRKILPRPRLFSKRFIAEQVIKRNRHRALVRRLQQDPGVAGFSPISVGTFVTAYHKKCSTIGKGRVLLHDPKTHNYLVQFNDKELGCEVCPDSEIAVIVTPTSKKEVCPPLYKPCDTFPSEAAREDYDQELVAAEDSYGSERGQEMERELLNNVVAFTSEAFERKNKILQALETCVAEEDDGSPSKHTAWLLANLERINVTLEAAFIHLQVLYGSLYGSPVSNTEAPKVEVEKMKLSTDIPKTKEFRDVLASLDSISDKIGEFALPSGNNENGSSAALLQSDLRGVTKPLLLANYLAETSKSLSALRTDETTYSRTMDAALKSSLDTYANQCLPSTSGEILFGKRLEQEAQIEREMKGLGVAVGMLRAEVAIATDSKRTFELNNAMV